MATRFSIPEGARLKVLTVSGNVTVTGEGRPDGEIEPGCETHISDDHCAVEFKSRSSNLHIRVPAGTDVSVGAVSGGISLEGQLGIVKVSTVSSEVWIDQRNAGASIRTVDGNVRWQHGS